VVEEVFILELDPQFFGLKQNQGLRVYTVWTLVIIVFVSRYGWCWL